MLSRAVITEQRDVQGLSSSRSGSRGSGPGRAAGRMEAHGAHDRSCAWQAGPGSVQR